jgi:hypothetical protein
MVGVFMLRAGVVALAALAAVDFLMFGGVYTHLVMSIASSIIQNVL